MTSLCEECGGFLPEQADVCPDCGARRDDTARAEGAADETEGATRAAADSADPERPEESRDWQSESAGATTGSVSAVGDPSEPALGGLDVVHGVEVDD
ncbi:MAG: hypothetical protein ABEL76_14375, partial [Bradymonadaceae bacterium]